MRLWFLRVNSWGRPGAHVKIIVVYVFATRPKLGLFCWSIQKIVGGVGAALRQSWAERGQKVAGMDRLCAGRLCASRGLTVGRAGCRSMAYSIHCVSCSMREPLQNSTQFSCRFVAGRHGAHVLPVHKTGLK